MGEPTLTLRGLFLNYTCGFICIRDVHAIVQIAVDRTYRRVCCNSPGVTAGRQVLSRRAVGGAPAGRQIVFMLLFRNIHRPLSMRQSTSQSTTVAGGAPATPPWRSSKRMK